MENEAGEEDWIDIVKAIGKVHATLGEGVLGRYSYEVGKRDEL